jgi:bactofilin
MAVLDASFADGGDDPQSVQCIYCRGTQQISSRAITITCKHCNKTLKIESLTIREYQARRAIETCGSLLIEKTGNVFTDRIICGSLVVRGRIKGNIVSFGPVLVGPEAQIKGDITAPSLAVGEGAVLEGQYRIGLT